MPVSFRGLKKVVASAKSKVLAKNTLATKWKEEDFLAKSKGLDLAFDETRFTFARRTKQYSSFWKKSGRTKMKSDYNRKVRKRKRDNFLVETIPFMK
ncbi:hypothetical protein [Porphyromonas pogonae]|mgnify:FL=1|jgi:hypothetical protein|uniref:hypothetical protein n=1 Tax=Porphyromonas pogonae TaxID=867595 RepID=UPI00175E1702|nr:hypothetical protein [Porphyromonas pogonae]HHU97711.1 hypothetical protein [Petrimonas sp.]